MLPKLSLCCNSPVVQTSFGWPRCEACHRIVREVSPDVLPPEAPSPGFHYLASPYSHKDPAIRQKRYESAQSALHRLLLKKVWTYSPIVHCHPLSLEFALPGDAKFWEEYNHTMLGVSKGMFVLTIAGWKESLGVTEEISFAKRRGLKITLINSLGELSPHA